MSQKLLILVPHQDDEINIAGILIRKLIKDYDIYVVYSTNGDFKYKAETRQKEAVDSLKILGVKKDNIYFMGYPDMDISYNVHVYTNIDSVLKDKAGRDKTYCEKYPFSAKNRTFTKYNFINDIKECINHIRPDLIVYIGYDRHPDHRALHLATHKALEILLKCEDSYQPEIYTTFAYSMYYDGIDDYSNINLIGSKYVANVDLINKSIYTWKDRIRLSVPEDCRTDSIFDNVIYKALKKHASQAAIDRVLRIVNSDIVYWCRRTDSLALKANIIVSSNQDRSYFLNDFMLYDTDDLSTNELVFNKYTWAPSDNDKNPKITLKWENNVKFDRLIFYGALNDKNINVSITISINDKVLYKGLMKFIWGIPVELVLNNVEESKCIDITLDYMDDIIELGEIEVFYKENKRTLFNDDVKFIIDDNFIYSNNIILEELPDTIEIYNKDVSITQIYTFEELSTKNAELQNLNIEKINPYKYIRIKIQELKCRFCLKIIKRYMRVKNKLLYSIGKL